MTAEADAAWLGPRLVAQPLRTFAQPVRLGQPRPPCAAAYILCTQPRAGFRRFAERIQQEPGWWAHELSTGHDAMVTMPRELADLLLEIAQGP